MLEDPAAQVSLDLVDDEARQSAGILGPLAERRPVRRDYPMQQRGLGPPALVAARWPRRVRPARRACSRERAHALCAAFGLALDARGLRPLF